MIIMQDQYDSGESDTASRSTSSNRCEYDLNFGFDDLSADCSGEIDSEDSLDDDNEVFLAKLNRKLDIESNHIQDFSTKLYNLKRELKSLKYESNLNGKSIMPDIFIKYFTNDKKIREKVHQLHYNTWKLEKIKKERKWSEPL